MGKVAEIVNDGVKTVGDIGHDVVKTVGNGVGQVSSGAGNLVGNAVGGDAGKAIIAASKLPGAFINGTGEVVNAVGTKSMSLASEFGNIVSNPVESAGNVVHETAKGAGNVVHEAGKTSGDIGQVGGNYLTAVGRAMWIAPTAADEYLFNGNLDKYSGGFVTSVNNMMDTAKEAGSGERIDDNLKDSVRVGLVTAALFLSGGSAAPAITTTSALTAYATANATAGMSGASWGQVLSTVANKYLPGPIANIVDKVFNPPPSQNVNYNSTYTPTSAADMFTYEGLDDLIPVVAVAGGAIVVLLLLKKAKKH